ncbi:VENN motif pre-toxin domain-containing protein [Sodalis sp.]|uniref:VENN motif pre-toxin domain-containing protein n=1 Tax=Sodalis sp. (in: enterobacteria) TaxID=1898979 RepID=UPI0038733B6D
MTGDAGGVVTTAQTGKNAVENNLIRTISSDSVDKIVEKIESGDKILATANKLIKLEIPANVAMHWCLNLPKILHN